MDSKAPINSGDIFNVSAQYRNIGSDPAHSVLLYAETIWILRSGLEQQLGDLPIPKNDACQKLKTLDAVGVVWPAGDQPKEEADYLIPAKQDGDAPGVFDDDAAAGKKILGIHGCIQYETYRQVHVTKFCLYYMPVKAQSGVEIVWGFCPGTDQNSAD